MCLEPAVVGTTPNTSSVFAMNLVTAFMHIMTQSIAVAVSHSFCDMRRFNTFSFYLNSARRS